MSKKIMLIVAALVAVYTLNTNSSWAQPKAKRHVGVKYCGKACQKNFFVSCFPKRGAVKMGKTTPCASGDTKCHLESGRLRSKINNTAIRVLQRDNAVRRCLRQKMVDLTNWKIKEQDRKWKRQLKRMELRNKKISLLVQLKGQKKLSPELKQQLKPLLDAINSNVDARINKAAVTLTKAIVSNHKAIQALRDEIDSLKGRMDEGDNRDDGQDGKISLLFAKSIYLELNLSGSFNNAGLAGYVGVNLVFPLGLKSNWLLRVGMDFGISPELGFGWAARGEATRLFTPNWELGVGVMSFMDSGDLHGEKSFLIGAGPVARFKFGEKFPGSKMKRYFLYLGGVLGVAMDYRDEGASFGGGVRFGTGFQF